MKINLTVTVLALTIAISRGDLYDTEDRLERKFGVPILVDGKVRRYDWRRCSFCI